MRMCAKKLGAMVVTALTMSLASAIHADETISENMVLTADADWRDKGVVTIPAGVTVNLNGHSLKLAGLAGGGTIDNPMSDLTTADPSRVSSPTTFAGGTASNLFNNNFTRAATDNTRRILVQKEKLPLVVDYDFGAGNEQVVNLYKVYCGPIPNYTKRCPKSWTFEGSNDKVTWTLLDSRQSETGWSTANSASECRTKTFENTTRYRYYRFSATAAQNDTDGFLELVQLEYFDSSRPTKLWIDVPAGATIVNQGVAITGNIQLVKDGEGAFVAAKAGQMYGGGTQVVAGTFTCDGTLGTGLTGNGGAIQIESTGTFDVNGWTGLYLHDIILAGGTLTNTGNHLGSDRAQVSKLTLTADSHFNATTSLGMVAAGYGVSTLDLNGHTLNVSIGEGATFRFSNTHVATPGTIKVLENRGCISFINGGSDLRMVSLDFTGDVRFYVTGKLGDLRLDENALSFTLGNVPYKGEVYGKLTMLADNFCNYELQDGSTLDIAERTNVLNVVGSDSYQHFLSVASNAVVTVNLAGRPLTLGEKLVRWTAKTRPVDVTFVFDAETAQLGISPVITDTGLFYGADPNLAEYAVWTGEGGDGNLINPANWSCTNVAGNLIENGLPGTITTVRLSGLVDLQIPVGATLPHEEIEFSNCQLDADCDWRGLGKFVLNDDAKLELNGHKLFVVGLAGSGEIAGGEFDLTTPDASRVSSPTTFAGGVAANLFNNNFTRSGADNTRRILVGEAALPVVVDYDFGESTFVDTYALYVGPEWCHRTPKMWQIYGSNGGDDWTLLDERTSPDIANSALCRRFTIATPAAYRLYRFKTDAPLGRDSPEWENLEMVQLEYGDSRTFGEFHVTVPEGETVNNTTVRLTGKLKFFKEGAGTFIATKTQQTYVGGTEVVAGCLQDGTYGFNAPFGNAGTITVDAGGRFIMTQGVFYGYPFVGAGGEIGTAISFDGGSRTFQTLTLTADSFLNVSHNFGLSGDNTKGAGFIWTWGNAPTTLDLNQYVLNVTINAGYEFRLKNAGVSNGTIRTTGPDGIVAFLDDSVRAETADFVLDNEIRVSCPVAVHDLILSEHSFTTTASHPIKVYGTFKTSTSNFPDVMLQSGATLDLRDFNGPMASESTSTAATGLAFADNATVTLDLRGRRLVNGEYAVTWESAPENLSSLQFVSKGEVRYSLSAGTYGIKAFSGLVLFIR